MIKRKPLNCGTENREGLNSKSQILSFVKLICDHVKPVQIEQKQAVVVLENINQTRISVLIKAFIDKKPEDYLMNIELDVFQNAQFLIVAVWLVELVKQLDHDLIVRFDVHVQAVHFLFQLFIASEVFLHLFFVLLLFLYLFRILTYF